VRAGPESVRAFVPAPYTTLGTDGFGRSDTRAALRDFFEVDAKWIAFTALSELYATHKRSDEMRDIADKLGLDLDKPMASSV
jgi:pyruvate dehydrogenase E1 component